MKTYEDARDEAALEWVKKDDGSLAHCPDCFKCGADFGKAYSDKKHEEETTGFKKLFEKINTEGGCIVGSADCSGMEISDARVRGDFYADESCFGYVRRLPEWLRKHSRYARNNHPNNCEVIADKIIAQEALIENMEYALERYADYFDHDREGAVAVKALTNLREYREKMK